MHRKRLLCWKAYLPRSSWPTQPTTPIICARPSLPKARSPSSPTTRHGRSNIRSTSISMPSAISWSAASQNSNNSAASQPASKRQPEITLPSSLSQPSSYGCDKCPHHLEHDPEKWIPVFPRDKREAFARRSCAYKKVERDDDSKKSHHALGWGLTVSPRSGKPPHPICFNFQADPSARQIPRSNCR